MPRLLFTFNADLAETPRSSMPSAALQAGGRWFEPSTAHGSHSLGIPESSIQATGDASPLARAEAEIPPPISAQS
jgi:hypothetical protein